MAWREFRKVRNRRSVRLWLNHHRRSSMIFSSFLSPPSLSLSLSLCFFFWNVGSGFPTLTRKRKQARQKKNKHIANQPSIMIITWSKLIMIKIEKYVYYCIIRCVLNTIKCSSKFENYLLIIKSSAKKKKHLILSICSVNEYFKINPLKNI